MVTVVRGPDAEEISYNGVDGGSVLEVPRDGQSIITAQGESAPGRCLDNPEENRLSKDQSLQIKIRVGDIPLWLV